MRLKEHYKDAEVNFTFSNMFMVYFVEVCRIADQCILRGGGVHHDYFVKLDFEIAVDQQTKARDQTFEGVPDSG